MPDDEPTAAPRQTMPRVGGKPFRCECGCNVFTAVGNRYTCNACRAQYIGEPAALAATAPHPAGRPE